MCGIAGILNRDPARPVDRELLASMNARLVHRGPDDSGMYLGENVGLASRRLAVIDLEGGHQPMAGPRERFWIVINGEIYNFRELRAELESRGRTFETASDTEVVVQLYEEFGGNCLPMMNGMFALAIWDRRERTLFLARDRFGKKPLYYAEVGGSLIFASELKAILAHPAVAREVDPLALAKYVANEYVPAPLSMVRGVYKLEGGRSLSASGGERTVRRWWELSLGTDPELATLSDEAVTERFRELLGAAVRRRLVSDVPLGVFLSGGIDSASVTAMMKREAPSDVRSFSIAFEEPSFDESSWARRCAAALGTEHHEEVLSADTCLRILPQVFDFLDEPLGDGSLVPTYLLSCFARKHVTVALGGDGGDELLLGYPTYLAHRMAPLYGRIPQLLRRRIIEPVVRGLPVSQENISFDFKARRFVAGATRPLAERNQVWLGSVAPEAYEDLLRGDALAAALQGDPYGEAREISRAMGAADDLSKAQAIDFRLYLQECILVKVDRASMATSLEVRSPFLDPDLVRFVLGLPRRWLLHRSETKVVLRRAMQDILPAGVLGRKKKGFGMPVARWLRRDLADVVDEAFSPRALSHGLFRREGIMDLLAAHRSGKADHRKTLWTLLVFQMWHRRYIEGRA